MGLRPVRAPAILVEKGKLRSVASNTSVAAVLAQRYAGALYELADDGKALDAVLADLKSVEAAMAESAELRRVMTSPLLPRKAQEAAVLAVAKAMGVGDLVRRFLGTLARNRRLGGFTAVAAAYRAILADKRGETTAEIVSAVALSDSQKSALEAALAGRAGRKITLDLKVDPRILGGLKVKVGSRLVDASLQGQLKRLHLTLAGRA
jgi:F-type H+-transporting ATPase subunit delta